MIDSSFLDELSQMELLVRKKVSTIYAGGRPSVKQGKGIEVIDYRKYQPGDEIRLIDWNLYARTEKLHIKRFMEERDLLMHLLVDTSASMNYGTTRLSKFDYAGSIAAGFGFIGIKNGEKYGFGLYSNQLEEVAPTRKSHRHLQNTIQMLNTAELSGRTDLGVSASQYTKFIKSKSYIIVLSDFLQPIGSIREGIHRLARESIDLTLIQVLDPSELDLDWQMDVRFEDMETHAKKRVYISPNFKKRYAENIRAHNQKIKGIASDFGIDFFSVDTRKPLIELFAELMGGYRHG